MLRRRASARSSSRSHGNSSRVDELEIDFGDELRPAECVAPATSTMSSVRYSASSVTTRAASASGTPFADILGDRRVDARAAFGDRAACGRRAASASTRGAKWAIVAAMSSASRRERRNHVVPRSSSRLVSISIADCTRVVDLVVERLDRLPQRDEAEDLAAQQVGAHDLVRRARRSSPAAGARTCCRRGSACCW